jgi:hypothetical protein
MRFPLLVPLYPKNLPSIFQNFAWAEFHTPDSKTVFAKTEKSLRASIYGGLRVIGDF